MEDVEKQLQEPSEELEKYFPFPEDEYFFTEAVELYYELELLLLDQEGKPRYCPSKKDLLKYVDTNYFEKSEAQQNSFNYLKKYVVEGDEKLAEGICEDIHGFIEVGGNFELLMKEFERRDVVFKSKVQAKKVMELVSRLMNNVRL